MDGRWTDWKGGDGPGLPTQLKTIRDRMTALGRHAQMGCTKVCQEERAKGKACLDSSHWTEYLSLSISLCSCSELNHQ